MANIDAHTTSGGIASNAASAASSKLIGGYAKSRKSNSKARRGSRKVGGKKSRKMPPAAKTWVKFVVDVFNKNRAKNPNYKYKQAMKDAAKLKKKNKSMKMGGSDEEKKVEEM
jgi:hypothetical protein